MAIRKFKAPSQIADGSVDEFVIGDNLTDFANHVQNLNNAKWRGHYDPWYGNMTQRDGIRHAREGHLPSVAPSDEFLAQVENLIPAPTAKAQIIDDVVGCLPNVPAMLAGQPLTMRRKVKREHEAAPIAVVVDTTVSGGLTQEQMQRRGAAILALVRAISSRRPVELWTGTGLGTPSGAVWQFWRINTAPLDLARAAFLLAHPAATRGLQYGIGYRDHNFTGRWPYGRGVVDGDAYRGIIARALPHIGECIAVPAAHVRDETVSDPIAWIKEKVAAHLGE